MFGRLGVVVAACAVLAAGAAKAETYRLAYEVEVLGVVVLGAASYEVTANASRYAARANLRTSGLARLFDQTEITATATGAVVGGDVSWARYDISHAYSGKFRRLQLSRANGAVSVQANPPYRDFGRPPASAAQQGQSLDPLTAVFALGRQIGAARACEGAVLVFDGRQHYRLAVAARGQGSFNGGGYTGPALNCLFRYEPISGFNAGFDRSRIPVADAWFGLSEGSSFAPPLRLTVPTPVGSARVELRSYERTA